jgi:peroxiredoxin
MSSRPWVLAGLLSGVMTGLTVLALVVTFGPEPRIARATPTPQPTPGGTGTPSATQVPASAPLPSDQPSGSPSASPGAPSTPPIMHVGESAPVLVVPQVGGGTIDVATLRGRPIWLVLMETGCSECLAELTLMDGFAGRFASADLVVLGIGVRADEGAVANFARRANATFPFGLDLDGSAQREWDATALPAHYWIDRAGTVRDAATGILGGEAMARSLGRILPGVDVQP